MSWEEALTEIGSHAFAAKLNVVSSMRDFFSAASKEHSVIELLGEMRASGELREEVVGRIYDLSRLKVDPRYENPLDTSLATLLWMTYLSSREPDILQNAAVLVDRAPQCWYAKKLARRLLLQPRVASDNRWVGEHPLGSEVAAVLSDDMITNMLPPGVGRRIWHHVKAHGESSAPEMSEVVN